MLDYLVNFLIGMRVCGLYVALGSPGLSHKRDL